MPPGSSPPSLLVVTDRAQAAAAGRTLAATVAAAVAGGARWVLLREKDLPAAERRRLAEELLAVLAAGGGGRLVVAGDLALARDVGAAGVHLAAADPWPAAEAAGEADAAGARAGEGDGGAGAAAGGLLVGRSCHDLDELRAARRHGAAYATLSPVFATRSKPGYGPPLGVEGLAAACAAVPGLPVLALGGVGPGRAAACVDAGAHGVAVMGEVMRADDPAAVVRRLVGELAGAGIGARAGDGAGKALAGSEGP
ncbi:MAG TPA: thiamine phosphate synthase [Acidimicrobiales bacterium]